MDNYCLDKNQYTNQSNQTPDLSNLIDFFNLLLKIDERSKKSINERLKDDNYTKSQEIPVKNSIFYDRYYNTFNTKR